MFQNYITTSNGKFFDGKNEFRFIGCNMYELAYVGTDTAKKMLFSAKDQGFDVIRFWAFENTDFEKFENICDTAFYLDLRLIPVLSDNLGYLQKVVIDDHWYSDGFKNSYFQFVLDITEKFSDRKEFLLWELINEPASNDFNTVYEFVKTVTAGIKKNNSNHLLSIGTIGGIGDKFGNDFSRLNTSNFKKLYSIQGLDAISIHDYSFNSSIAERLDIYQRFKGNSKSSAILTLTDKIINFIPDTIDRFTLKNFMNVYDIPLTLRSIWQRYISKNIQTAKDLMKPIYIGEIGFKKSMGNLRRTVIEKEFKKYLESGVSGILLWSFESEGMSKDGHGYGFDESDNFKEVIEKIKMEITDLQRQ